jgi:hypothetical protein
MALIPVRFRLFTLLAVVAVFSAVLGLAVTAGKRVWTQRQFMHVMSARYGNTNKPSIRVYYDHECSLDPSFSGHAYATSLITDLSHQIEEVQFGNLEIADSPDADAQQLSTLPSVKIVGIQGISDAGIESLCHMKSIEDLEISDCDMTDRGLDQLASLPRLKYLDVSEASNHLTIDAVARFRKTRPDVKLRAKAWWTEEAERRAIQTESGMNLNESSRD